VTLRDFVELTKTSRMIIMKKHFFIVFSNAKPEREDAYREWYRSEHIHDQLTVEGFEAAQLLELTPLVDEQEGEFRFCAIYEVAEDKLEEARNATDESIRKWREAGRISPDLQRPVKWLWYTTVTNRVPVALKNADSTRYNGGE
jgi:hypothetical protein